MTISEDASVTHDRGEDHSDRQVEQVVFPDPVVSTTRPEAALAKRTTSSTARSLCKSASSLSFDSAESLETHLPRLGR